MKTPLTRFFEKKSESGDSFAVLQIIPSGDAMLPDGFYALRDDGVTMGLFEEVFFFSCRKATA